MNETELPSPPFRLSKRESEIVEILYRLGRGGVAEVRRGMSDPPGYSSVRKQLEILEDKGYVWHEMEGRRYVYEPRVPREEAARGALMRVVRSFFRGDVNAAMASLLSASEGTPSEESLRVLLREAQVTDGDEE